MLLCVKEYLLRGGGGHFEAHFIMVQLMCEKPDQLPLLLCNFFESLPYNASKDFEGFVNHGEGILLIFGHSIGHATIDARSHRLTTVIGWLVTDFSQIP